MAARSIIPMILNRDRIIPLVLRYSNDTRVSIRIIIVGYQFPVALTRQLSNHDTSFEYIHLQSEV
jgi:hypothetical protein